MTRLIVNVDGGARGNPGPGAIAAVLTTPDGEVVDEVGELIGRATNNEAEYRALLLGIERARRHGATEVELIGDSELIAKQVLGQYKVKKQELKPFHRQVLEALRDFDSWSIRTVPREQNEAADALVNATLDG